MPLAAAESPRAMDLTQFYDVFFAEAAENLSRMEQLLVDLDTDAPDDETLHAIFRCAHSIKGGAATFGFSDVTALTHVMETLLDRLRRHELPVERAMVDVLLAAGDELTAMLDRRQDGETALVDDSDLIDRLTRFAQGGGTCEAPAPAPAVPPQACRAVQAAAATPPARELQMLAGPLATPSIADDLIELFSEVGGAGDLTRADPLPGQDAKTVRFRLATSSTDAEVMDLCGFHVGREQIQLSPWPCREDFGLFEPQVRMPAAASAPVEPSVAPVAPVPAADRPGSQKDVSRDAPKEGSTEGAKEGGKEGARSSRRSSAVAAAEATIRVGVGKVDQLINLMGELVITQAMLSQRAAVLDRAVQQELMAGLADLERTTRDLQDSVMSIRMIPMAEVFNRFPRMLRDLAGRLGKKIEFVTAGEATELDKGLIEKITDPLTHLVRNAVDHGIELPAERLAAGKPAHGTLRLSAQHEGGSILIQVRDDGRGLDRERILAKARSSGLPLPERMTDGEVWQLIFAPGFSTAEVVTDISGRGVGMDVVKRNILALGGTVDLESTAGAGTCVSVRLPLTLAIMDGMSVAIGDELFILPLATVVESFQTPAASLRSLAGEGRVIKVREDYLPVVVLRDVFGVTPHEPEDAPHMLVIVEAEGRRVALQVERLVGQQQVVVKNLESNYRKVPNVSGATIMGDGRVALILDVAALSRAGARAS